MRKSSSLLSLQCKSNAFLSSSKKNIQESNKLSQNFNTKTQHQLVVTTSKQNYDEKEKKSYYQNVFKNRQVINEKR